MPVHDMVKLIEMIDGLLARYQDAVEKNGKTKKTHGDGGLLDSIIEHGVYAPDDPATPTRLALNSIGETLGLVGGFPLMVEVHQAYEAKYGTHKASALSARWDATTGLWYH